MPSVLDHYLSISLFFIDFRNIAVLICWKCFKTRLSLNQSSN